MNRNRIIDHPLRDEVADLENYNFMSTGNRRVEFADQNDENREEGEQHFNERQQHNNERTSPERATGTQGTRSIYHHLQVLDEDAENFRSKLDTLINGFKNETMSEFMQIKRNLLQEQQDTIENETRKFNRIVENRTNEVIGYFENRADRTIVSQQLT